MKPGSADPNTNIQGLVGAIFGLADLLEIIDNLKLELFDIELNNQRVRI